MIVQLIPLFIKLSGDISSTFFYQSKDVKQQLLLIPST
jgi:hypothetical protein